MSEVEYINEILENIEELKRASTVLLDTAKETHRLANDCLQKCLDDEVQ